MQVIDGRFIYSASDLNAALECAHLSELERLVAREELQRPASSPTAALLATKGAEHETRQLERYRRLSSDIVEFDGAVPRTIAELEEAQAQSIAAMASGATLIYQATFFDGQFLGRADFLRRVERPSAQWAWSYEVIDSKLALTPKPTYLVQLANYSEHVERVQGTAPHDMHVLLGSGLERSFRLDDVAAYYRNAKTRFLERMARQTNATYPFETSFCSICRWNGRCEAQRNADDHLSLVARIRKDQIAKLEENAIGSMTALAHATDAMCPGVMNPVTFETLRAQAKLQHDQRTTGKLSYELLDNPGGGFELLPVPDEGDIFFDMEGDPLYSPERGLEYLFGAYLANEQRYVAFWAKSLAHERAAFEAFVDFIVERRKHYPRMHVYHYASYEASALKRLMGYYGSRENEVNDLLRNEVLVDLYGVTRGALRISQSSYSIKKLEPFYGMKRSTGVQRGDDSIVMFESWLATGEPGILEDIERYNDDDCRSTHLLLQWLLERRRERSEETGEAIPWRAPKDVEPPEDGDRSELAAALLAGIESPTSLRALRALPDDIRARWLLGNLLDYHAREARPAYWKLYDRYENLDGLLERDHESIAGLRIDIAVAPFKESPRDRNLVYTYTFPEQHHSLARDDQPHSAHHQAPAGKIVTLDDDGNRLQIKLSSTIRPDELVALIPGTPLPTVAQRNALARIARQELEQTLASDAPATRSILLAALPRFATPRPTVQPTAVNAITLGELVADLDRSHLVVQGPPGTGKSTLGASFIVDLLARKKRVAIVANGHKAIHNLLHKIEENARSRSVTFVGLQKHSGGDSAFSSRLADSSIECSEDNKRFAAPHDLAAGTSWLFAREELVGTYDYLIIDEAGQMSLADAIACSACARNVVLLGDPLQLAQVSQGTHPPGTNRSVLAHLLGEHETIPPGEGVFLDRSYRMAPAICDFISHVVYEDRLHAAPACAFNAIDTPIARGSGLFYAPVVHENNVRRSDEEAAFVTTAASQLLRGRVTIGENQARPLRASDIIVVAPYNAQRKRIRRCLAAAGLEGVAVGTVDKFQGQEAAVVFYSMATSSGASMPRDLEFLFEKNRMNVAISRAQCASILVCSPELMNVRAGTPEEVALVNLLCTFAERATKVESS